MKFSGFISTITALVFLGGCNSDLANKLFSKNDDKNNAPNSSSAQTEKVNVSFELMQQSEGASLNLTMSSNLDYSIDISGCASGYAPATITSTAAHPISAIALYKNDMNCVAKLKNFNWGGVTYSSPSGGMGSGSEIFSSSTGKEMRASVVTPLGEPIDSTSKAVFVFQEVKIGDNFEITGYSESAELEMSGLEAPNLKVDSMSITSISDPAGVATFTVVMECNAPMNGTHPNANCPTAIGGSPQQLNQMKVKLVSNDFGANGAAGDPNYAQAEAAFVSPVAIPGSSASVGTNGGATITGVAAENQLYTHKDMILFVQYKDVVGTEEIRSYRYFKVHIGDPQ